MHTLILSQYWYPENGVPQRRWAWLTELLVARGHQVTVIAPRPHYPVGRLLPDWNPPRSEPERGPAGELILRTPFLRHSTSLASRSLDQSFSASAAFWKAVTRVRRFSTPPDVVISTVPAIPTAEAAARAAARLHIPYVIDLRDAWPELLSHSANWNEAVQTRSWHERLIGGTAFPKIAASITSHMYERIQQAAGVLVTADGLGERLRTSLPALISSPEPNIATVRNVFPFSIHLSEMEPRQAAPGSPLRILYAGTHGRAQDLHNALVAVRILTERGVPVEVRMVGGGAAKVRLQEFAEQHRLPVEFYGRTASDQLDQHFAWADTLLVHLADWEPMQWTVPSKLYEAMELGKHVTAVVDGEAAGLVRTYRAGHVVPPHRPEDLADFWHHLSLQRENLQVSDSGRNWVKEQRERVAPANLLRILERTQR